MCKGIAVRDEAASLTHSEEGIAGQAAGLPRYHPGWRRDCLTLGGTDPDIDLSYCAKMKNFGRNVQGLFYPGSPMWVSEVLPGFFGGVQVSPYLPGRFEELAGSRLVRLARRGRAIWLDGPPWPQREDCGQGGGQRAAPASRKDAGMAVVVALPLDDRAR
jgi:hypothetical protein